MRVEENDANSFQATNDKITLEFIRVKEKILLTTE